MDAPRDYVSLAREERAAMARFAAAVQAGVAAHAAGQARGANPFVARGEDDLHAGWRKGWEIAEDGRRRRERRDGRPAPRKRRLRGGVSHAYMTAPDD